MIFQTPKHLFLLWLIPILIALYIYANITRKKQLKTFIAEKLLPILNPTNCPTKQIWKTILTIIAIISLIIALSRPAWNPHPSKLKNKGRDAVFVLDVSKSMLATDMVPNRLQYAKLLILDALENLQGDRVALILFAGDAKIACPLTRDYNFFKMTLKNAQPSSIKKGGTMIGDAIRVAVKKLFKNKNLKYRDLIFITDGEDHDSSPINAAAEAGEKGVRIITIGIGDEKNGQRIPTDNNSSSKYIKYNGQYVWSKLDSKTLRKMATVTNGQYFPVSTNTINFGEEYAKIIKNSIKQETEEKNITIYEEKFQIFITIAIILLIIELLIGTTTKRGKITNE